jgi:hypothetical protein
MAIMGRYCKAYAVEQLRKFAGWRERLDALAPIENEEDGTAQPRTTLADDDYLFLQETFVVTDGIFQDEHVVFDDVTPEWKAFCTGELAFEIPDYVQAEEPPVEVAAEAAAPDATASAAVESTAPSGASA